MTPEEQHRLGVSAWLKAQSNQFWVEWTKGGDGTDDRLLRLLLHVYYEGRSGGLFDGKQVKEEGGQRAPGQAEPDR